MISKEEAYVLSEAIISSFLKSKLITNLILRSMRKLHMCRLMKYKCKSIHECRRRGLINSFFNAQFNYCSLIWLLLSHNNNNIAKVTFIRNVLDYLTTAITLLIRNMDGSFFINRRNIQALVAEILKSKLIFQLLLKYFVHEFDLET